MTIYIGNHLFNLTIVCGFVFLVSLLALLNSLPPVYYNQYAETGYFCWISQPADGEKHDSGFAMRLALKYCQCMLVCVMNAWLYIKLYRHIEKLDTEMKANRAQPGSGIKSSSSSSRSSSRAKETMRKFIYYPRELCALCYSYGQ